jgi:phospholipid/cholesterol/gamma-HCH transport system permease protein
LDYFQEDQTLTIRFPAVLSVDTVAGFWEEYISLLSRYFPEQLILDCSEVTYCDGAGLSLLMTLEKRQIARGKMCLIEALDSKFRKSLDFIEKQHVHLKEIQEDEDERLPTRLGFWGVGIAKHIQHNLTFFGRVTYHVFYELFHPHRLHWRSLWRIAEETGSKALPLILLIGFLIGLISSFQAAPTLGQFGAQIFVVNLVALGLMREMGPLMTAMLLAGRTASSFAAELGTMKINQEIDALSTMGLNPVKLLVVPRILATLLVTPFLTIFLIFSGLLGSAIVMYSLGYPFTAFTEQLYTAVRPRDYLGGLVKITIFSVAIAGIGCLHGFRVDRGAKAVGHATTAAVVSSIIMTVVLDGILAIIYYTLGI